MINHAVTVPFKYPDNFIDPLDRNYSISVIISNYNHSEMLKKLIYTLLNQNYLCAPFEIVIGDSGSNKENQRIIKDYLLMHKKSTICRKITYVYVDKSRERYENPNFNGFSCSINAAVKASSGNILVYCDSSILVPGSFIVEMAWPIRNYNIFIRAPLLNLTEKQTEQVNKDNLWETGLESFELYIGNMKKSSGRPAWAIAKDTFLKMGGLDESMNVYGAIDDDFVSRLMLQGIQCFHSQTPVIHMWHKESRNNHGDINAKIMQEHIKNKQWKVNENIKWGTYNWKVTNE